MAVHRVDLSRYSGWVVASVALPLMVGCGAPELATLQPTVSKPAAMVFLVDHPAHWSAVDVQAAADQAGVYVDVVSVSTAELANAEQTAATNGRVGLICVVQPSPVSDAQVQFAAAYPRVRFDIFAPAPAPAAAANVRQLIPQAADSGYALGWMAGQMALQQRANAIGFAAGGSATVPLSVMQATLAGANVADAAVPFVLVSDATASPGNIVSGNVTSPVSAPPPLPPPVVVALRPLSAATAAWLQQAGTIVLSLVPQASRVVAAPSEPGDDLMAAQFDAFVADHWQPGTFEVDSINLIGWDTSRISATNGAMVQNIELGLAQGSISAKAAWTSVPPSLRSAWAAILAVSG